MKESFIDLLRDAVSGISTDAALTRFLDTPLAPYIKAMGETAQSPDYHAEGDVLTHTRMVLDALKMSRAFIDESDEGRLVLYLAALLHDIGKPAATRVENGEITSPHHARLGAQIARRVLWQELGFSGDAESIRLREAVCLLIKYHSFPPYCYHDKNDRKLHRIASNGTLTDAFSLRRLSALEEADVLGRKGIDASDIFERVSYCKMLADELGILDTPYTFTSDYTRRQYFKGKLAWRGGDLYKPNPFEVILMAGLPGTGKDTYIKKHFPTLPVVSLDGIRERLGIRPDENQGEVMVTAREEARVLLRKRTPFVWNATSITDEYRSNAISLFESYGASVRCVYLETDWRENLRRNAERERNVPEAVIDNMLRRLEIPEAFECERVEWVPV